MVHEKFIKILSPIRYGDNLIITFIKKRDIININIICYLQSIKIKIQKKY